MKPGFSSLRVTYSDMLTRVPGTDLEMRDRTAAGVADAMEVISVNGLKSPVYPVPWRTDRFSTIVSEDSATVASGPWFTCL